MHQTFVIYKDKYYPDTGTMGNNVGGSKLGTRYDGDDWNINEPTYSRFHRDGRKPPREGLSHNHTV